MTLVRNRAGRKLERCQRALARLERSLRLDLRFTARTGPVAYDADHRRRAHAEGDALALRIAELSSLVGVRTKKDRSGRTMFRGARA